MAAYPGDEQPLQNRDAAPISAYSGPRRKKGSCSQYFCLKALILVYAIVFLVCVALSIFYNTNFNYPLLFSQLLAFLLGYSFDFDDHEAKAYGFD